MTHLPLCNISFNDSALPIDCNNNHNNHNNHKSYYGFSVFTDTNERHYMLLFINKVLYYMDSPFRCIEIPYYDFVICDLCDCFPPFCICKDTKYNQKYKILNV